MALTNKQVRELNKMNRAFQNCDFGTILSQLQAIIMTEGITATASALTNLTDVATITLGEIIPGLVATNFVVKKNGTNMTLTTDYSISDIETTTPDITFVGGKVVPLDVITIIITKDEFLINGGNPIAVANEKVTEITASASTLTTSEGITTITLGDAVATLANGDIAVNVDDVPLTITEDYTITDITTDTIDITFLAGAALTDESVITIEITKAGYLFNDGDTISVTNEIPVEIDASSSAITTATGMITITLSEAVATLANGDITVNVDATPLTITEDYTIADVTTDTIDITFLAGAALTNASVITIDITKAGYVFNDGDAIAVTNSIV